MKGVMYPLSQRIESCEHIVPRGKKVKSYCKRMKGNSGVEVEGITGSSKTIQRKYKECRNDCRGVLGRSKKSDDQGFEEV